MLEELPNLSNPDPQVSKNSALKIIHHVSKNKGELDYLVKRLVTGLESSKVATRAGSYTMLASLLSLGKVDPFDLFDLMQKVLITNKESTKKERRLIYIARILCTGAIFRTAPVANLAKDEGFLQAALKDLVELSQKKSTYFLLTTPFICHLLQDNSLTQEVFDGIVWPAISILFAADNKKSKKKKVKAENEDSGEEEEEADEGESDEVDPKAIDFACKSQIALDCRNGEYKSDFECLGDVAKIAKALLVSHMQFEENFLNSLCKYLSSSPDHPQVFWETFVDNIKSTQFDLLCLAIKTSLSNSIPVTAILSKKLVRLLLSIFKSDDKGFHKKSTESIILLLKWDDKSLSKTQRKSLLKLLFSAEEPPNLLHEYKFLHQVIRPFLRHLNSRDLKNLHQILESNLFDEKSSEKLGPRMAIVNLQTIGRLAQLQGATAELKFEITKRLLSLSLGKEQIPIKVKKEVDSLGKDKSNSDQFSLKDTHLQIKKCCLDSLSLILSSTFNSDFITLLNTHIIDNISDLSSNESTLKSIKDIKKALKKVENPQMTYILCCYSIRILLDEGQPISKALESLPDLLELAKISRRCEDEAEFMPELWRFVNDKVVREPHPAFNYEGMFNRLLIEGKVKEDVIQVFAEAIDVEVGPEGEAEDSSDDDEEMEADKEDDDDSEDEEKHPKKKSKLDPAQIAKLKETIGEKDDASDSEESIALDEATEEDLQQMDSALAKVFGVKKAMKEEEKSGDRALMRTLRLVELYIGRNIKGMPVSSLLILLMPVVHALQNSLKLKNSPLPTKVIAILDNMNRIKKFAGCDDVVEGTFATIAEELYELGGQKRNKLIKELLEHSVILLTKCYLQKENRGGKKEQKKFIRLYCKAVDIAKLKMKTRKRMKRRGRKNVVGNENTSRFVRLALDSFGDWEEGKKAINERIRREEEEKMDES